MCVNKNNTFTDHKYSKQKITITRDLSMFLWCAERELNPHGLLGHSILSAACLPIPSPAHIFFLILTPMCSLKTVTIWT